MSCEVMVLPPLFLLYKTTVLQIFACDPALDGDSTGQYHSLTECTCR